VADGCHIGYLWLHALQKQKKKKKKEKKKLEIKTT
jgi:hypothetical protein